MASDAAAKMATNAAVAPGDSSAGVPKWVYALAIGVPVTAALVYILFGPGEDGKKKKKPKPPVNPEPVRSSSSTPVKKDKVTIEDVEEVPTDPLERAVAAKNRGMYLSQIKKLAILIFTQNLIVAFHIYFQRSIFVINTHEKKINKEVRSIKLICSLFQGINISEVGNTSKLLNVTLKLLKPAQLRNRWNYQHFIRTEQLHTINWRLV